MPTHSENVNAYRDLLIGRAVSARKIAPDRAEDFRRLFAADPNTVERLLTAPVEQGGLMAGVAELDNPRPIPPTEYPREWIAGSRPTGGVVFEDQQTATAGVGGVMPGRSEQPARTDASRITIEP